MVPRVVTRPTIVAYNARVYIACEGKLYTVESLTQACVAWMFLVVRRYNEMLSNNVPFNLRIDAHVEEEEEKENV